MKVLIICQDNLNSSAIIEAYLTQNFNVGKKLVRSAGLRTVSGQRVSKKLREYVAKFFGIYLANHESRQLDETDFLWADRVYYCGKNNDKLLKKYFPEFSEKLRPLAHLIGKQELANPSSFNKKTRRTFHQVAN